MNAMMLLPALVQGLVAGIVALIVEAVAAATQGRTGVTFVELLTAAAVGVAIGAVSFVLPKVVEWQMRRTFERSGSDRFGSHVVSAGGGWAVHAVSPGDRGGGAMNRFGRFSDRARRVLTLAQDEAQRFNHNYIGTEHLLLGLVRGEGDGLGAGVLTDMGIELAKVRTAVEFIIGRGDRAVSGEVGLSPNAKRVIELAIDEARQLGHHDIGTEHLLLGLIAVSDGIASQVLESFGVSLERTRAAVLRAMERGRTDG